MKTLVIDAKSVELATEQLKQTYGLEPQHFQHVSSLNTKHYFEVLSAPVSVEVDIPSDGMRAYLTKINPPFGKNVEPITLESLLEALKRRKVVFGLKKETIEREVIERIRAGQFDYSKKVRLLVAEGTLPQKALGGKAEWLIDKKLFKPDAVLYCRRGEVFIRARHTQNGVNGFKVTGDFVPPPVDDTERVPVGPGIEVVRTETETRYVAKHYGQVFFDEGIRLRVEPRCRESDGGMKAIVDYVPKTLFGAAITPKDLMDAATDARVVYGILSEGEILKRMKAAKSSLTPIVVAEGVPPVDGKMGELVWMFKTPKSPDALDLERAKKELVFPGEAIVIIKKPSEPKSGRTIFGEELKGRAMNELPVYPGKNVVQERAGEDLIFKAVIYGKVKIEKDRVSVFHTVQVSQDKMKATIELFPQIALTIKDIALLAREADILFGIDKDRLEKNLADIAQKKIKVENFSIAEGKPPIEGFDAKVTFAFDPAFFKKAGFFEKKVTGVLFALPGDLLATKILPIPSTDGVNIFRERIEVKAEKVGQDIALQSGKRVFEEVVGEEGNEKNPRRIEYRAAQMGTVIWKEGFVDVEPTIFISKDEKEVRIKAAAVSDFKTRLNFEMLKKLLEVEGVRVPIDQVEFEKIQKSLRPEDKGLQEFVVARAVEPKHGTSAKIDYVAEVNGENVVQFLERKDARNIEPMWADFVRPGDILATKTAATPGEDGMSVLGRRIVAERGFDEPWFFGQGVEPSATGLELKVAAKSPGFLFAESGRLIVRSTVRISADKLSATIDLYPSKNPRFLPREDKVMAMLQGAGIPLDLIKRERIVEALDEIKEKQKPIFNLLVAEGRKSERGKDAQFIFQVETDSTVGEMRDDGSIDFKARAVFHAVNEGQLLVVKKSATCGASGVNVLGQEIPGTWGSDTRLEAGHGVEVSEDGLRYVAKVDGIVEFSGKSIRVISGILLKGDVDYESGSIEAGATPVFVKGSVKPDFKVFSEREIRIEGVAEACHLESLTSIKVMGGIVGRDRAMVRSRGPIEAQYISVGATVEAEGDIHIGTEVLNSYVRTAGTLHVDKGAGTILGGEIWAFEGLTVKTLGAVGSENQPIIYIGQHYFKLKEAEAKIKSEGIQNAIDSVQKQISEINKELRRIYEEIPAANERSLEEGQRLQAEYKALFEQRQGLVAKLEKIQAKKEEILKAVPVNKDFKIIVKDLVHPGVSIRHGGLTWTVKDRVKAVEITWNPTSNNFYTKRA